MSFTSEQQRGPVNYCRFAGTSKPPTNIAEKPNSKKEGSSPVNKIARLLGKLRRQSQSGSPSSSDSHKANSHLERQNCPHNTSDIDLEAGLNSGQDDSTPTTTDSSMLSAIDPTFGGKLSPPPLAVRAEIEALNAELQRQSLSQISPTQISPKKRSIASETVPEETPLTIITDQPTHATIERLSSSSGTTTDSAVSSTNESRRNSGTGFFGNGAVETGVIRPRRSTVTGKVG